MTVKTASETAKPRAPRLALVLGHSRGEVAGVRPGEPLPAAFWNALGRDQRVRWITSGRAVIELLDE